MTVQDKALIEVQNLTDHLVVYKSFDGIRQVFQGQQIKKIRAEELRQLNYTRGGSRLLREFLSVKNQELAREFNVTDDAFENEYNWTVKDVNELLQSGSLDRLKDALDFAPDGIIDLIVDRAVKLRISDVNKRKAIAEATGKDINSMIMKVEQTADALDTPAEEEKPEKRRRVTKEEESAPTGRRVQS